MRDTIDWVELLSMHLVRVRASSRDGVALIVQLVVDTSNRKHSTTRALVQKTVLSACDSDSEG